jgi:sugar O-acyltransferase (sialic acid O-acetyltransferase NeuD family)
MNKAIIGFGGHAREVMAQMGQTVPCFVDDEYTCKNSLPLSKFDPSKYLAMIAIGDSKQRKEMFEKLPSNTKYFSFVHPSAQIMNQSISIGEGSFIGANCILTTNIKIGKQAILNRGNHISHDCIIGDFFSAMPNSIVSGNVKIGDIVYLGANSCTREKIKICNDVIIGMNSGVVKNINNKGVYIGTPAKQI